MKNFFPKLNVRDICILGVLTSITVVLAVFGTFRVGEAIKIPTKFVSVFISAVLYGPVWGGIVAATGDLFNCLLAPSGVFLPQITAVEFLGGAVFGLIFYSHAPQIKGYVLRSILCTVILFAVDMFLTTAVLVSVGIFPSFVFAFSARIIAGIIKASLQLAFFLISASYIHKLRGQTK